MIRDVSLSLVTRVLVIASGVITSVLTARALGAAGRGEYFLVLTLAGAAVQFGNLGLASSNTYFLAKDRELLARLAANSFWVSLLVGLSAAAVVLGWTHLQGGTSSASAWMVVLMVPTMLYSLLGANLLVGLSLFRPYNLIQLGSTAVQLVAVAVVAQRASGPLVFLAISAASGLVGSMALMLMLSRLHRMVWRFDFELFRTQLSYAGRAYVLAVVGFFVSRAGVFLLDRFSGKSEIGLYSIAVQFADVLAVVPSTVALVLFPELLQGPVETRFERTMRTVWRTSAIMLVLCVATGAVALWVVPTFFGPEFASAVRVLWWMLPGVYALSLANIVSQYLAAHGIPLTNVMAWLGALIVACAGAAYLVPRYGAAGAGGSFSLTYAVLALSLAQLARRHSALETRIAHSKEAPWTPS